MKKIILVSLAILTVSTSAALAAHRTHHSQPMKPIASAAAPNPNANVFSVGGASSGRLARRLSVVQLIHAPPPPNAFPQRGLICAGPRFAIVGAGCLGQKSDLWGY
jgi:hypothetical protein